MLLLELCICLDGRKTRKVGHWASRSVKHRWHHSYTTSAPLLIKQPLCAADNSSNWCQHTSVWLMFICPCVTLVLLCIFFLSSFCRCFFFVFPALENPCRFWGVRRLFYGSLFNTFKCLQPLAVTKDKEPILWKIVSQDSHAASREMPMKSWKSPDKPSAPATVVFVLSASVCVHIHMMPFFLCVLKQAFRVIQLWTEVAWTALS